MAPWWHNFQWRFWIFEKKIICLFSNLGFRNLAPPPVHKFTRWSLGKCSFSERGQCYIRGAEKKSPISISFVNGHIIFAFAPRWEPFYDSVFCTFSHRAGNKALNTSYLTESYIAFTLKMESVTKNTIFGLKMMVKSGLEKLF